MGVQICNKKGKPLSFLYKTPLMNLPDPILWRWSSILLFAGGLIFWIGAFTPPYKQWTTSDTKEYLSIIQSHRINWYVIHGCFLAGIIITLFGVQLFSQTLLSAKVNRIFPQLAAASFYIGTPLWILNIAFRMTVTFWAANIFATTNQLPDSFQSWMNLTNFIFAIYMVLAYFGIGCLGISLREATMATNWLSWFFIIFGFGGIIGYAVQLPVFAPPLMVHLPFIILGGMTLFSK